MTTGESAVEKPCTDTTVLRFKIDSMQSTIEQLKVKVSEASEAAMRGMRAAMKAVGMRGPDPDYDPQDDDIRRLAGIIERLAQRPPDNGYHEAPKESGLKAIIVGCTITLLSTMIIAAFMLTNEFAAFKAQVNEWQKSTDRRLEMLERRP